MASSFFVTILDFPDSTVDKESACNAIDPGSICGLGRSTGEGIGYPLQYSWASLVSQLAKNRPAMQETWVQSLGWEDPLEKGKATHSSILTWRISYNVMNLHPYFFRHSIRSNPFNLFVTSTVYLKGFDLGLI